LGGTASPPHSPSFSAPPARGFFIVHCAFAGKQQDVRCEKRWTPDAGRFRPNPGDVGRFYRARCPLPGRLAFASSFRHHAFYCRSPTVPPSRDEPCYAAITAAQYRAAPSVGYAARTAAAASARPVLTERSNTMTTPTEQPAAIRALADIVRDLRAVRRPW